MIVHTPKVCGGRARINGYRMPVWVLQSLWEQGCDIPQLCSSYPFLSEAEIQSALDYAAANPEEIESDRLEHENCP